MACGFDLIIVGIQLDGPLRAKTVAPQLLLLQGTEMHFGTVKIFIVGVYEAKVFFDTVIIIGGNSDILDSL